MDKNERKIAVDKRNHDRALKDIKFIVGISDEDLSQQAKYDIIHKIAWEWTEGQTTATKYYGCKYWSKTALGEKFKGQNIECGSELTYTKKCG